MDGRRVLRSLDPQEREVCLERLAQAIAKEPAVLFAYAFGSFTEGRPFEDVDVGVVLDSLAAAGRDSLALQFDLAAHLEQAVGLPIDIVLLDDAPLGLRATSLRGRLLFSRDEERRFAYVERTGLERMDTNFLAREALKDLL